MNIGIHIPSELVIFFSLFRNLRLLTDPQQKIFAVFFELIFFVSGTTLQYLFDYFI